MKFVALVTIIGEQKEEEAIKIAKDAGAGAVTIVRGRSLGLEEKKIFFGLTLEESVSVLIFVLPKRLSMRVLKSLKDGLDMQNDEVSSIAFTFPISHIAGLNIEELHKFENEIKEIL